MRIPSLAKPTGLRERNKQQKQRRIYLVARRLFERQGYDSTTMRQIAEAADVAEGTVFLYARDKRELLFRIFKDDLLAEFESAFNHVPENALLLEKLLAFLTPLLQFFQPHGALARIMIRENLNLTGPVAVEVAEIRASITTKFARLITEGQQRGEVRTDQEISPLIDAIWASFRFYVDDWLAQSSPVLAVGIARLEIGLTLLFDGIRARPASNEIRRPARRHP